MRTLMKASLLSGAFCLLAIAFLWLGQTTLA